MKKLFTFLSRANNYSLGKSLNHRRVSSIFLIHTFMVVLVMILAPSAMKAATITMDFRDAAYAAYNAARFPNEPGRYYANIVMSDISYNAIGNGAKVGDVIHSKNANTKPDVDISRLALTVNTNGAGNAHNTGYGFYLRMVDGVQGLYTGNGNSTLAVLNLKPGDKVKIKYAATSNIANGGANIRINNFNQWRTQLNNAGSETEETVDINFMGDLSVRVNQGTIIQSITIVPGPRAQYQITTESNKTTFAFTQDGLLDENDYTIPYLQASFGNINDFLMVSGLKAEMHKSDWSETLETGGHNFQPSAGSFYEFRPTAGGKIEVDGSLTGRVHLFVYDPTQGIDTWVQKQNNYVFYKLNFPDTNNGNPQPGSDNYDANYKFTDKGNGNVSFSFSVEKNKYYYICIDNTNNEEKQGNYAFHLHSFSFTPTFHIPQYAKIVDLDKVEGDIISLVKVEGAGSAHVKVKRVSGNFTDMYLASLTNLQLDQFGWLSIPKPAFKEGTDNAGTIIFTIDSPNGDATFVVTFPYHASYDVTGDGKDPYRTYGHTWNFIDPRNSDSNIGNCREWDNYSSFKPADTTTGILSIGRYVDTNSTFHYEVLNREWTYSQRQTGSSGGFHDPYYANVWDMEGNNADMIWETEGLWFETGTNLSCIHNENDAVEDPFKTNPLNFTSPGTTDPDRYVGLLPVTDGKKSSFTIPGLKPGDRVLIFMKSGEGSGDNGIFLNITGAKDALGKQIEATDLYKAGGTNWQHDRYEGCYHFIKDDTKDPNSDYGRMTFDMKAGSMCKLMYIHIYTGQRIVTTNIVSKNSEEGDDGRLLFINDKGAELGSAGSASQMSLRFRGKGQNSTASVLTYSGSLNANSFTGDYYKVSGTYNHLLDFKSKVGEMGMFRLRMNDVTYEYERTSNQKITYVADFCDRNFTVGYRDKVEYPYTWDFTDIQGFSQDALSNEDSNYPISAASQDKYGYEWDISLFDANGNMKVNTGYDPITNNLIFSPHKIGFGNQLWAGDGVIPETRGLWFYSEDDSKTGYTSEYSSSLYNDCLQITSDGIRFANTPDDAGKRVAWWNYKMVVPDVPADGAVYLRMKRDNTVKDADNTNGTPFLATKFHFGTTTDANQKTSLSTSGDDVFDATGNSNSKYSFYKVPGTDDEYIVAVLNTGDENHLTFTLNGWIVEKVAVSTDSKTVNEKGWASESRDHVIDPELTAYMTGYDLETCIVTDVDYDKKTVTLTRVHSNPSSNTSTGNTTTNINGQYVMRALSDGAKGASIIHNKADNKVEILDIGTAENPKKGFHLFVPDMHDYTAGATDNQKSLTYEDGQGGKNNLFVAQVSAGTILASSGDYTNYALSYKYYKLNPDGTKTGSQQVGDEAFYRIANNNTTHGANSSGNQGYLPLLTSKMNPYYVENTGGNNNPAKFTIIFEDEFENITPGITTTIDDIESSGRVVTSEGFYNLNGQKMNGIPTQKGMYIVNGKKVLVK